MDVHTERMVERLFEALISGDRPTARSVVDDATAGGFTPERIVGDLFWPTYELIEKLHRGDKLSTLCHHMASRLLRVLVDQTCADFTIKPANGRTIFAVCGPSDSDELAAQMAADLLEAEGFQVSFAGGGIANDEILERVQDTQPDVLVMFASAPSDLPNIRELIDTIHEIGACRKTQIAVGGGVFNRAEGLAEEIGADLWATDPRELVIEISENPEMLTGGDHRTVGRNRTGTKRRVA
jgi:methanogenic corrinoid protein MtbC1